MNKERFYDVINAILSFLFCRWLFMTFLFYQFTTIFMTVDFLPSLTAILLMTGVCFTLFRLVYQPGIPRLTLLFFYGCYSFLLIHLLFFKSMGVRGVNWDLLSTFSQDLLLNPAILVFNLLLFLPLGLLFSFSWEKFSLFVGAILLVEACQFFFSLGFFDLGDILLNISGFALGNFLGQSAIAQSFNNRI
ncbi:TPA: VanZ family protein [Streptococcus suis]